MRRSAALAADLRIAVRCAKSANKGLPCMQFFFIIDKWLFGLIFRFALYDGAEREKDLYGSDPIVYEESQE